MKRAVKKKAVKQSEQMEHPLIALESLLNNPPQTVDKWLLVPVPEPRFAGLANRQKFLDAVARARVLLVHDKFGSLYDHARELSDAGGILRVEIVHIRSWTRIDKSRVFIDGKMEDKT